MPSKRPPSNDRLDVLVPAPRRTRPQRNRPQRTRPHKDVVVRFTRIGRGVFARRAFESQIMVDEIEGEVIHDPDYSSSTCMDLGDGMSLEASAPFRYLNHSCEPNCELVAIDEYDEDDRWVRRYMALETLRDIAPQEELTIDYAWPADAAIPCQCGARRCRGWVVDPAQLAEVGA